MKDSLIREILQVYYDWDRIESNGIIDFDLVGEREAFPPKYQSRKDIAAALVSLKNSINKTMSFFTEEDRFIMAKIDGSLAYLDALKGSRPLIRTYLRKTLGVSARLFSRAVLNQYARQLVSACAVLGIRYERGDLERYIEHNLLGRDEIMKTFVEARDNILPRVMGWLDIHVPQDYVTEFVDEDVYWMNWISTRSDGKILLRYNTNKRHQWVRGSTEYLVLHEVCGHFLQVSSWQNQIKTGSMNPAVGLTTVFTCEQIILEGIAEALWYFLPFDTLSQKGRIAILEDHLYWMVMNNVHIMANEGAPLSAIWEFVASYLPRKRRDELEKIVKEKTTNALLRSYQYSYGYGLYFMKSIASSINTSLNRQFLHRLYTSIMAPRDIQLFARSLV